MSQKKAVKRARVWTREKVDVELRPVQVVFSRALDHGLSLVELHSCQAHVLGYVFRRREPEMAVNRQTTAPAA